MSDLTSGSIAANLSLPIIDERGVHLPNRSLGRAGVEIKVGLRDRQHSS